jgi:hypothetical protein
VREFLQELKTQRWDDHRYYHHCRINQTLHLISALSFLCAYAVFPFDPATAALIAWMISMTTRQTGHFFFEPKTYDTVNEATHEYKESIKVGYNLRRKVALMLAWVGLPVMLLLDPSLLGTVTPAASPAQWLHQLGLLWLALGVAALAFRVMQLTRRQSLRTGLVWATKILTDPFHDVMLYWRAPFYLMRGERLDPMGR